ncbi:BTAD domain-containing putative transcriptional regulator [Micromonospora sp. FIMYZ51]|uniref:AfsR/SARP family transcriptional regulator n=1 Tax=Micromonospora sp. FIMYZ51 TaxID=3051832 RepID=UPI00311EEC6F
MDLGPRKQQAIITLLALRHGEVVPTDEIADALWGDRPPGRVQGLVHTYVARLRQAMEPDAPRRHRTNVIASADGGYQLLAPDDAIDLTRFRRLVERANARSEAGDSRGAFEILREAMHQWPKPELSHLDRLLPSRDDAGLLRQEWIAAATAYVATGLDQRDASTILPVAGCLAELEPLNEAVQSLHLEALRQNGQGAAALSQYAAVRIRLRRELGVEPAAHLRRMYNQLIGEYGITAPVTRPAPVTPAARTRWLGPGPAVDPLLGRDVELEHLQGLLSLQRLVTLTGPVGVGKSALARALSAAVQHRFAAGVAVVDLSGLHRHTDLVSAVRNIVAPTQDANPRELSWLFDTVADRQLLLVLDNVERLLEPCVALVDGLLRSCPGVCVVTTSRELLGLPYEAVRVIGPLPVPSQAHAAIEPAQLLAIPAVGLFARRAAQAQPCFRVDRHNAAMVATVCRRLDGLPLALELAAACLRTTGLADLVEQAGDPLRGLSPSRRGEPAHHRSLRAALNHSLDGLTVAEQRCLALVATLGREFHPESAQRVARELGDDDLWELQPLLARLVDRSLLAVRHDEQGLRYRMLRLVRALGLELLHRPGPAAALAQRLDGSSVSWLLAETKRSVAEGPATLAGRYMN